MTDESTQFQAKKDETKKTNPASATAKGPRRTFSNARPPSATGNPQGASRPSSRAGNKKPANSSTTGGTESGSENDSRSKNQPGSGQPQVSTSQPNRVSQSKDPSESSDALSSLQRVIADLKTTTPSGQPSPTNTLAASIHAPQQQQPSNPLQSNNAVRHRKAASLGNSALPGNYNSFSPHLVAMMEDAEDGVGASVEEGEISEGFFPNSGHHPRTQSQNFVAPHVHGPTGRPQRTASNVPLGPPINEEDQQQQQNFSQDNAAVEPSHRKPENDITGIMAEQIAIQNQIEALQQQQQALYQQQLASNQVLSLQAGLPGNRHRRVQSTAPMGLGGANNLPAFNTAMGQFNGMSGLGYGLDNQPGLPRGHGRRHSVNVVNKSSTAHGSVGSDGFDDGFTPPGFGGHSRTTSRVDSSWRINGGVGGIQANSTFAAELAQAQAQLQSLQQFRAAAGGHHHKMPSFAFPNMLPNMMAANLMGVGLGGVSLLQQQQQQQQQFQTQLQQQSSQPQRKSLFAPYLPQASLPPLLAAGKLVVGILRVNKRNRSDAYVATEVLDADIYICGSKDRNRALEGDIVAVELLDVDEVWGTKKEKEEKKRKKEENSAYDKGSVGRKDDKKKDDVEVEGQGLMLFEDEEVTDEVKPQYAGHVVAVVERMPGQLFSGTLGLLRPSSAATKEKQEAERREREGDRGEEPKRGPVERPKIVWFKPTDKRVPLIAIPTEQAPADFVENSEAYANKLFVACIKRHVSSSSHFFPPSFGTLVEELGPIGDVEVETSALLKDCNFPTEEFSDSVIKCLPPTPWSIPEREYEVRRDLREERIFTIDPSDAKDMDDALSIRANDDGTYDVGVHVADVSYFVKPNTALDRDARKRATTVYLVQRAVPMLPPTLGEDVCSLAPGTERLAFSAIFTMSKEGKVLNKWFGKTIVKSAAKLSYADTQKVIDGHLLSDIVVSPEHSASAIEHDLKVLHTLAQQLRTKRLQDGALLLDSTRLEFTLDDNGSPVDCKQSESNEAKELVEELMLLANIAVAQRIAVHLPEQALLRRHDTPIERRLTAFSERAKRLGVQVDSSSSGTLMRSFNAIANPAARMALQLLSFKFIQRAKYFCAGMLDIAKYGHYALSVPLYTHFTSPIRRYADILVHRQLESVLQGGPEPKFTMDRDAVAKVAQQCNIKRDSAKLAQEQSTHLFLCVLISDLTYRYGSVIRQAKVVNVLDAAFDVYVPEFGIEKRVHVDQMPIDNHVYDEHSHTLQIYWSGKDVISWLAENSDDEHLKKVKQNAEAHATKMEVASRSVHDEKALFDEDDAEDDEIVLGRDSELVKEAETSKQRLLSASKVQPVFEGLKTTAAGHKIQEIKELMTVPVSSVPEFATNRTLTLVGDCDGRLDEESSRNQGVQCESVH
ncbi:SSD1 protein [Pisolithus sp. B1]|nr:SSD1 protein [Pisolithus sp. B1]